ncbi:unnamed protein product [Kluyveromyces dobzhanskii CBS 2104]|uniref:WGS project CCBQ000000000 data, contig 00015 n=1 Tax=Kluyveromyces dobzhanskii CBS 2104 TaxID=1427455 RepID=A0A0A8LAA6_9SACH|nr:unnamed protein product [Kluyveromyces dobzhanskii CBS 2104]
MSAVPATVNEGAAARKVDRADKKMEKDNKQGNHQRRKRIRKPKGAKSTPEETVSSSVKEGTFINDEDTEKKFQARNALKLQRKNEIEQMSHLAGSNVTMLRKGQYVTTYSIKFTTINQNDVTDKVKCVFNIPLDYPQSAIKLSRPKDCTVDETLSQIINNFNHKARHMLKLRQPIIVQLNFLVSNWNLLKSPEFLTRDRVKKTLITSLSF